MEAGVDGHPGALVIPELERKKGQGCAISHHLRMMDMDVLVTSKICSFVQVEFMTFISYYYLKIQCLPGSAVTTRPSVGRNVRPTSGPAESVSQLLSSIIQYDTALLESLLG